MGPLHPAPPWRHDGLSPRARHLAVSGMLAGAFLLAVLSVHFAPGDSDVASWWPAAAFAVTSLLVGGRWRVLVPLLWVVTGLANLAAGREPLVAAAFGLCNAAEAVVVALVLTRGRRRAPRLDDLRDGGRLLVASLAGATVIGVTAGAVVSLLMGGDLLGAARSTTSSHSASNLVVLPVLLLAFFGRRGDPSSPPRVSESGLQAVVLAAAVAVVFGPGQEWPLAFAVFPPLVWASLRLRPGLVTSEVAALAVAVSLLTAERAGPFGAQLAAGSSPAEVGALVQVFLVVTALVTLPLVLVTDERRRTLQELAEQSGLTDAVLDSEAALVLVLDPERRVVRANAAATTLARGEYAVGHPVWRSGLLGEDDARVRALLERTCANGERVETTLRIGRASTTLLWSGRTTDLPGQAPHHVLTAIDVTHHRSTEELLRRFMNVTTGSVLVGMDLDGTLTLWNAGAEQHLGWRAADVVGTPAAALLAARRPTPLGSRPDETRESPTEGLPFDPAQLRSSASQDWDVRCRDGSTRVVHVTIDVTSDPGGEAVGYVAVGLDVTQRRAAQRQLEDALERERESVERLAEASRIKSDLVASVSHELRTPLTNILGYAQLLRRGAALGDRDSRWVDRIDDNGHQLLALIEDLLLMARVETADGAQGQEEVDLSALVRDTAVAVQDQAITDSGALGRGGTPVRLTLDVAPGVVVRGESRQLDHAVRNLLLNAIKFSPDGGVVRLELAAVDGGSLLRVSDEGIGIAPDELEAVFQPFVRGSRAESAGISGTGLGLGIVRAVVESHGGVVWADSEPGRGTTMTWWLPAPGPQARCIETVASSVSTENGLTT